MGCFYHFCPCQQVGPPLTEEIFERGIRERERERERERTGCVETELYKPERLHCD